MDCNFACVIGREKIVLSVDDVPAVATDPWVSKSHNHADYELHILLRGRCKVDVEGTEYTVGENCAFLIAPGQYHRSVPVQGDFERFSMTFSVEPGLLLRSMQEEVPLCRVYPITAEIASLCRQFFAERIHITPFRRAALQNLLSLLLIHNFRLLQVSDVSTLSPMPPSPKRYTEQIDGYFEQHLADAKVEHLAEELHLSRSQVNRVLKKHYGMTFREKLIQARLDRAARLLRSTELRVDAIAAEVGYTAPPSFYQVFKLRLGMTPETYRVNFQKQAEG